MEFTLEELQHMMANMNGMWSECQEEYCPICDKVRQKIEAMIEVLTPIRERGVRIEEAPEWLKKLGVNTIERVIE